MDKQLTVLITRPQPGADAFAECLVGIPVVISPLMVIKRIEAELDAADVVAITSSHAIPALDGHRCYCVGTATTKMAQTAGNDALMGGKTAEELARQIIADRPKGRIVYARGRHVAFDLIGKLQAAGLNASETIVYDQLPAPLSDEAMALLGGNSPIIVPLFSARSARLFFEACPAGANLRVIAMSQGVADIVPEIYAQSLTVLLNPDAETMADAIRNAL